MELSIIILVYNQGDITKNAIESILRCGLENYELVIVDNCSEKETENMLQDLAHTHKEIVLLRNEVNKGFILGNNEAIKISKGEFICIANNDIIVKSKSCFLIPIQELRKDSMLAQVGAQGGYFTAKGSYILLDKYNYVAGWFFVIPRSIYEKFGLFDEKNLEFAYGEDVEFSFRLLTNGYKIKVMNLPIEHLRSKSFENSGTQIMCTWIKNEQKVREMYKEFLSH